MTFMSTGTVLDHCVYKKKLKTTRDILKFTKIYINVQQNKCGKDEVRQVIVWKYI